MSVTVTPQEFKFVAYNAALIQRVAEELLASLGLADRDLHIEVDETTPLARTRVEIGDALSIRAESGSFEDTKRPRQQSEVATATSLGRLLLRVRDRLVGGFGEAPPDDDLTLAQVAAWETYCVGRLSRLGIEVNEQRWRYNFRNRHGFTDAADEAFNRLWSGDALTWGELEAICAERSPA
jgi:hypothetical protein